MMKSIAFKACSGASLDTQDTILDTRMQDFAKYWDMRHRPGVDTLFMDAAVAVETQWMLWGGRDSEPYIYGPNHCSLWRTFLS